MATIQLPADMPSRMRRLPRDEVGRPIPYFAATLPDGSHDFRFMEGEKLLAAIREQLCWVCGQRLNRVRGDNIPRGTFVAGPMCLINRTSAEPPCHYECAEWSAKACPFLSKPAKSRRETNVPDNVDMEGPGIMIRRNPGVTALIDSARWKPWVPDPKGVLFSFSRIEGVHWVCEGRSARGSEVLESIESGIGQLLALAREQDEAEGGGGALRELAVRTRAALRWAPISPGDAASYPTIAGILMELPIS